MRLPLYAENSQFLADLNNEAYGRTNSSYAARLRSLKVPLSRPCDLVTAMLVHLGAVALLRAGARARALFRRYDHRATYLLVVWLLRAKLDRQVTRGGRPPPRPSLSSPLATCHTTFPLTWWVMLVSSRRLEALRERELYTRDLIGLRALDRRGKLHFAECDCAHRHVPTPSCRVQVWDRATKKFLHPRGAVGAIVRWLRDPAGSSARALAEAEAAAAARLRRPPPPPRPAYVPAL